MTRATFAKRAATALLGCASVLAFATAVSLEDVPQRLDLGSEEVARAEVVDRRGVRLSVTYENRWNLHDRVPLHEVPSFLRVAMVEAEDRRFFDHSGVDWPARFAAVWQNLRAGRIVRGASTLTEQVVRMIHPRPRSAWSRWLEGFEAMRLEARFSKGEILSFYLDQVPYARQRRGVVQAARDLFDRDLETLSHQEMLALAVLVRRPSGLDPRRHPGALEGRIQRLRQRLVETGHLARAIGDGDLHDLELGEASLPVRAPAFVRRVRGFSGSDARIETTLDARLQNALQPILDAQIDRLRPRGVQHGAVVVIDHVHNEVTAWLNASGESEIDAVTVLRQPGSTLKPFVYGLALEQGWNAATPIEDSPLNSAVGRGLHRTRNYSHVYRGPIRLRLALANSLNVPAIRAMRSLPAAALHQRLTQLGFESLDRPASFYGEGLALGNGEVSLLELASAYAVLARGGLAQPVQLLQNPIGVQTKTRRVFDAEVASILSDILADADAREAEFGRGGILDFPVPAAVKTGTSDDYRDSWAVGFTSRYTAAVWMGDLARYSMKGVTGAAGPAVVLRSVFSELHRFDPAEPLAVARQLRRARVCGATGAAPTETCPIVEEWFRPGHVPVHICSLHQPSTSPPAEAPAETQLRARVTVPTPGLHLAMDPRIPDELEVFTFSLDTPVEPERVDWIVNGVPMELRKTADAGWEWPLAPGTHRVTARVRFDGAHPPIETAEVEFSVR